MPPLEGGGSNGANGAEPTSALSAFLGSSKFRLARNATDRFLAILAFVHAQDPSAFEKVVGVGGSKRRYFGTTREEIARSGKSTHPQRIPDSEYWAMTNADTYQKRTILRQVLRLLSYSEGDVVAATTALK